MSVIVFSPSSAKSVVYRLKFDDVTFNVKGSPDLKDGEGKMVRVCAYPQAGT